MKKINWKEHLKNRIKIIAFIFALVGWFLIITVFLEEVLGKDLSPLENFVETSIFKWGIKIFVIILLITLIKGQSIIDRMFGKHTILRSILKIIIIIGLFGWIVGLGSLVI